MPDISNIFSKLANCTILVVGDVMLDRYLRGRVDRISPEAPVPVIQLESAENRLGGAANVALNIAAMGSKPLLCSVIGTDPSSQLFRELLPEAGISDACLWSSPDRPTTVKTRVIAANQHLLRVDSESLEPLNETENEGLLRRVRAALDQHEVDLILFQDYNKGVLSPSLIRVLLEEAKQRKIPTAVDPKFANFFAYQGCTLFKPNLKEIREAFGQKIAADQHSLDQAVIQLEQRLGHHNTLITLSEKGIYWHDGNESEIVPTIPRNISDVCGAGDTVISIAALGIAAHLHLRDISILANLAGGQVCESVGVVPVDRQRLEKEYLQLLAANKFPKPV